MDPLLKDWIEVISWGVAIIGGLIAAFIAIYQLAASNDQRKRELRWEQAKAGKELIDEMFDDSKASAALAMIDSTISYFEDILGQNKWVSSNEVLDALKFKKTDDEELVFPYVDSKSVFIRNRFDGLFYYLERFKYFEENKLVEPQDVRVPAEYYAKKMAKNNEKQSHKYLVMLRFTAWRTDEAKN